MQSLRPILASRLCTQKFRSPRRLRRPMPFGNPGILGVSGGQKSAVSSPARNYRGFNPRASNCRRHSAGASRSRSTPMPRGKRPSTAARTRSGARNASEIVMLTWRTLHFWRVAICLMSVTEPETISSSQRRPRAMALTRRARRSIRVGRTSLLGMPCGIRICLDLLEGGFCHGIESK